MVGRTQKKIYPCAFSFLLPFKTRDLTFLHLSFRPVRAEPVHHLNLHSYLLKDGWDLNVCMLHKDVTASSSKYGLKYEPECEWVWITFRPLDTRMLVVTQEESFSAAALIAAHHVDTNLLASSVAFRTLVHICQKDTHKHKLVKGTSRQNDYRKDNLFESCLRSNHYLFIGPRAVWNHVVPTLNRQVEEVVNNECLTCCR